MNCWGSITHSSPKYILISVPFTTPVLTNPAKGKAVSWTWTTIKKVNVQQNVWSRCYCYNDIIQQTVTFLKLWTRISASYIITCKLISLGLNWLLPVRICFSMCKKLLTTILNASCWKREIHRMNTKTWQSKETLDNKIHFNKRKQATEAASIKICLIII